MSRRVDNSVFWNELFNQLRRQLLGKLSKYRVPVINNLLPQEQLRSEFFRIAAEYAQDENSLFIVAIDGIDHAARANVSENTFLSALPNPEYLPENVKIVIAGQPKEDYRNYPEWLFNNETGYVKEIHVPSILKSDIYSLVENKFPEMDNVFKNQLTNVVCRYADGNTLSAIFAVHEATQCNDIVALEQRLTDRKLSGNIQEYYKVIWDSAKAKFQIPFVDYKMAGVFAFFNEPLNEYKLQKIFSEEGISISVWRNVLKSMRPLLVETNGNYTILHNDIRVYLSRIIGRDNDWIEEVYSFLASYYINLSEEEKGYSYYNDVLRFLIYAKRASEFKNIFTPDFIISSFVYGIGINEIYSRANDFLKRTIDENVIDWEQMKCLAFGYLTIDQIEKSQNEIEGANFRTTNQYIPVNSYECYVKPLASWNSEIITSVLSLASDLIDNNHADRAEALLYNWFYDVTLEQILSKEENLQRYEKNTFDAIVIDEAHHSAANSYKKVLDYFEPKLWLGMTATPDKRDDNLEGRNIYEIFNHQIAYEIRLQDAMEEDLLCPFHYFGITDLDIIADAGKSSEEKVENFRYLTSEERVENVMKQAEYFGYSGDRVKGLIFCSRIDEAKELSKKFNDKGWRTLVLSGSDSEETRAAAIERLAGEESEDALDYIISVDIFSEGVDVPEINQVIMLRPTESPIVFIQQLGRGLRKAENKEYVVVLDFIGNYRNNFMIPIALSGDRSYNKDNIRRYVTEGGRVIPGASTIHFDEISRKRIFQAIDNANFSDIKLIRENYTNLKNKLGHIPALADFDKYGEMDVLRIFDNNSLGSYYKFLVKYEKEYTIRLSEDEEKAIEFISKKLASGKRIHELELLKRTLQYRHGIIGRLRKYLSEKYHCEMDEHCTENVINMMTNEFPTSAAKKTYAQCVFLKKEQDDYGISDVYGKMLENPEFCAILEELVDFGISRYKVNYSYHYQDTNLVLYQKYTYEDACRLLNWERNEVPLNIGGYKYDKKTKTFPIFINYDKQDNISDTTKYEDHFVAENRLIAISKSGRSMDSEDVQNFLNATERGIDVQLFVRKNKDDKISKEFYYLGRVIATGNAKQFVMPNTDKTAVEIEWELETPVREDIYQYIVNE